MNSFIETEGKYFKECKPVMLPTEDRTDIIINKSFSTKSLLQFRPDLQNASNFLRNGWTNQHLYITSDDEIKEDGTWCLNLYNSPYTVMQVNVGGKDWGENKKAFKKIIATTDESLFTEKKSWFSSSASFNDNKERIYLPQPSQSFIKKFCKLGGIDKVLVEYDTTLHPRDLAVNPFTSKPDIIKGILVAKDCVFFENSNTPYSIKSVKLVNPRLKTDSHNTITIKEVKEKMYSREEVEVLCHDAYNSGHAEASGLCCGPMNDTKETSYDWIKENL